MIYNKNMDNIEKYNLYNEGKAEKETEKEAENTDNQIIKEYIDNLKFNNIDKLNNIPNKYHKEITLKLIDN